MTNRLLKDASAQYIPAVKEVIGRPGYCVTTTESRPVTRYTRTGTTSQSELDNISKLAKDNPTFNWSGLVTTRYSSATYFATVRVTKCYPAVEPVEGKDAEVVIDNRLGWNSGGRSIAQLSGDILASFKFSVEGAGMLCGLAPATATAGVFSAVTHGLQVTIGAAIRVFESGVEKSNSGILLTSDTTLRIQRTNGVVKYTVDDWEYTSAVKSYGPTVLMANMYSAGDYVEDPTFNAVQQIGASSYWGWPDWFENSRLQADAEWGWDIGVTIGDGVALLTLDVNSVSGDHDYSALSASIADFTLESQSGAPVVETSAAIITLPTVMSAFVIDIGIGTVNESMDVVMLAGDYDYTFADLVLDGPEVTSFAFDEPEGTGVGSELLLAFDSYFTDPVIYALVNEYLSVGDTFSVLIAVDAALADMLFAGDAVSATQVLTALLESGISFSDNASNVQSAVVQYVTNLANGAVGRYEGYDFQGFCRGNDSSFGWKRDGLYRLGEQTDDGETISALLDFAAQDFGAATAKRLKAIYFGVDTDGMMYAKLTNDREKDVVFRVQPYGTQARMQAQRGESSRYWRLQLQIVDATFAEIDGIEWVAGSTGRRITR